MALLGGGVGGAGNPVGGSFTGPAEALEIVGDHAYAYSGSIDINSGATALDFTTGNYYFVGKIYFTGNYDDGGDNFITFSVDLNGTTVLSNKERRQLGQVSDQPFDLIIPPYTEVSAKFAAMGVSAEFNANMVGKIYRTRD